MNDFCNGFIGTFMKKSDQKFMEKLRTGKYVLDKALQYEEFWKTV